MEIKVLWYESQDNSAEAAFTEMLQHEGVEVDLLRFHSTLELRSAIEGSAFGCAVIVHDGRDDSWREALDLLASAPAPLPMVILLNEDDTELREEALLAGAWHAVPRKHTKLCAAALRRALQHAKANEECSRTNEALKVAQAVLEKSQRSIALGVLLASIAHEINNPLESVANLLYLARRGKTDAETLEVFLDMSEAELNRVTEITKQMLSFHRNPPTPQNVSVAELLDGILILFTAKLRERQITVDRQYESAGWMVAYPGEIRQAFVNLIANALDATDTCGRLTLRIRERGGSSPHLCVSIGDSGKGMPRHLLRQIGELFLTTKGAAGTGIGLWVTRRVVQKYQGSFRGYSSQKPGRSGTVFTLCFPPPHARLTGNAQRRIRGSKTQPEKGNTDQDQPPSSRRTA